jgi:hypothetical protein
VQDMHLILLDLPSTRSIESPEPRRGAFREVCSLLQYIFGAAAATVQVLAIRRGTLLADRAPGPAGRGPAKERYVR